MIALSAVGVTVTARVVVIVRVGREAVITCTPAAVDTLRTVLNVAVGFENVRVSTFAETDARLVVVTVLDGSELVSPNVVGEVVTFRFAVTVLAGSEATIDCTEGARDTLRLAVTVTAGLLKVKARTLAENDASVLGVPSAGVLKDHCGVFVASSARSLVPVSSLAVVPVPSSQCQSSLVLASSVNFSVGTVKSAV